MKVTVEDQSSVKKILHIEVPKETVSLEIESAYDSLKKSAKIKGFRPGKAPRSVLERIYKKDVQADVTSKLIQTAFLDALKETELRMVGSPEVNPPELDGDAPYSFDAVIEVKPEIADIDFEGLALKKTMYKPSEEEMDAQLNMLQRKMAKLEKVETTRPLADGDFAMIDYEGFRGDEPYEETQKTDDFTLKIGDGAISESFDNALKEMLPGDEKRFTISFPEDHFNQKLAGQEITFNVTLKEIREEVLPPMDDEFAKGFGPFATLDDLKKRILENLERGYEKRTEQELNEQIFSRLLERTEFEVPESLIDMELDGIIHEAESSFSAHNTSLESLGLTREMLAEKYRDTAEKQVRRHLLLGKLIEQEKMELPDEALEKGFLEIADAYQQPVENIKRFYKSDRDKLELLKHTLLEKQIITLIIDKSEIEEVAPEKSSDSQDNPEN